MRFRLAATVLLAAALAAPQLGLARQQDAQALLGSALQKMEAGDAEGALADLDAILAENDAVWPAHFHRGRILGMLQDGPGAQAAFLRASELNPGNPDIHFMVAFASYQVGEFDTAWQHLIAAKHGGLDEERVQQGLGMLQSASSPPADLDQQLAARTVFVDEIDTSKVEAKLANPFARSAESGGASVRASGASSNDQGNRVLQQSAAQLAGLRLQLSQALSGSPRFGLVQNPEFARYRVILEIDDLGDAEGVMSRLPMEGALRLVDASTGEDVHRQLLDFDDLSNGGSVRADLERVLGLLEEWAAESGS